MMPLRILSLLLALLAVATLASAPAGIAQSQEEELSELWKQYPLETRDERPRPVGAGEENGSTAGPPPKQAEPAGPIPLALLFLALALGVVLGDRRSRPGHRETARTTAQPFGPPRCGRRPPRQ